jgi:hypothetical protein
MTDPVIASRSATDHATGNRIKLYDADTGAGDPRAARAYVSGNNHHIEIRAATDKKGMELWSGEVVPAFEVAKQLTQRLRELDKIERPFRHLRKRLSEQEKEELSEQQIKELTKRRLRDWKQAMRDLKPQRKAILAAHPLIDRSDNDAKGGKFVMSLADGEMLLMKHKATKEVGYFVVAKLDKPQSIVVVPHWDARAAGERKDAEGKKVAASKRDQFAVTPTDLKELAPPGQPHAVKACVSPLAKIDELDRD